MTLQLLVICEMLVNFSKSHLFLDRECDCNCYNDMITMQYISTNVIPYRLSFVDIILKSTKL